VVTPLLSNSLALLYSASFDYELFRFFFFNVVLPKSLMVIKLLLLQSTLSTCNHLGTSSYPAVYSCKIQLEAVPTSSKGGGYSRYIIHWLKNWLETFAHDKSVEVHQRSPFSCRCVTVGSYPPINNIEYDSAFWSLVTVIRDAVAVAFVIATVSTC